MVVIELIYIEFINVKWNTKMKYIIYTYMYMYAPAAEGWGH
jgi:hypothetical protein